MIGRGFFIGFDTGLISNLHSLAQICRFLVWFLIAIVKICLNEFTGAGVLEPETL